MTCHLNGGGASVCSAALHTPHASLTDALAYDLVPDVGDVSDSENVNHRCHRTCRGDGHIGRNDRPWRGHGARGLHVPACSSASRLKPSTPQLVAGKLLAIHGVDSFLGIMPV
eukprot:CAMPEP_0172655780 /NCGR_PEP_ID=MMETSP1074-20121228/921_1 /TAXON_ID=2916 /ORGANISM="Ceratium fusus, Strain PA161109" /LENGTH=112 /DNA_ID=CAMNT_0013470509 /DNA_START=105 /DNA_END=444 /DNA_ORIENTATION=-